MHFLMMWLELLKAKYNADVACKKFIQLVNCNLYILKVFEMYISVRCIFDGVQVRMVLMIQFSAIFEIIIFCFVVTLRLYT